MEASAAAPPPLPLSVSQLICVLLRQRWLFHGMIPVLCCRAKCRLVCRAWEAEPMAWLRVAPVQRAPEPGCFFNLMSKPGFDGALEELFLADMSMQNATSLASTERMLSMLQTAALCCPALRRLGFTAGSLCSGGWAAAAALLHHFRRLKHLQIYTCLQLNGAALDASLLASLPALRCLILWGQRDVSLRLVPEPAQPPPSLRQLVVRNTNATTTLACAWRSLPD